MRTLKVYMVWMSLTCAGLCSAQVKEKVFEEISVIGFNIYIPIDTVYFQTIGRLEIAELQPDDLGQLLQKFAGTNVKNYGGPGSLKTLNFRGLGGQHTRVLLDGFESSDAQSGQLNFGQVPTSNIDLVKLDSPRSLLGLTPSSMIGGQVLTVNTNLGRFPKGLELKAQSSFGSFALADQSLLFGFGKEKLGIQAFGRIRQYEGEYPFKVTSGNFQFEGNRAPTDLKEFYGGLGLHWRPKKGGNTRMVYRVKQIDQSLPGSIVLYNNFSRQFLDTKKHQLAMDHNWSRGKWNFRPFLNAQVQRLEYLDEHYQNIQGFLKQGYLQSGIYSGLNSVAYFKNGKRILHGGFEHKLDHLLFDDEAARTVNRQQLVLLEELDLNWKNQTLKLKLGGNLVLDNDSETSGNQRYILPNAGIQWVGQKRSNSFLNYEAGSIWSYRLPSFNEMYFGAIGNQDLEPENAFQNRIGIGVSNRSKKFKFLLKGIAYANWVENKIVAIPTKNLFVWSIQNVDRVRILGGDLRLETEQVFIKSFRSKVSGTYSFQMAQNRTAGSVSFNDQIAYIPMHSGNVDVSLYLRRFGIRVSNYWTGLRYTLNQNNVFNQLSGFGLLDLTVLYDWKLKNSHKLRGQVSAKNITNQSVQFVRGFTMPGRNFLISLSYEI